MVLKKNSKQWTNRIKAKRRMYRGAPTIFVNGKPITCGAVLFCNNPIATPHPPYYGVPSFQQISPELVMAYGMFEVGNSENFTTIERWLDKIFSDNPQALGACHIGLRPSLEWALDHPKAMTLYDRPVDWIQVEEREASWASQTWQRDSAQFVKELVHRLHKTFSGRVILYQVGAGACAENCVQGNPFHQGSWYCGDFGESMLTYFRARLRDYYNNNLAKLRIAWGDTKITFETALIPDRIERMRTEWFSFRSLNKCQTADYYRALCEAIEDCTLIWAKSIKQATNHESITATPMGSMLDSGLNACFIHQLQKSVFTRAASSPDIDMFESPASYAIRDPGRGGSSAMIPLGTLRLAGKIWLRDFDTRTSVVAQKCESDPVGMLWKTPKTPWEDIQILKRDAAYSLLKGGAFWWNEIEGGMFKLEEHIRTAKHIQAVARGVVHADRSMVAGLAVLTDAESNFHQANSNRLIYAMNYEARRLHWFHTGMASEVYQLDDVQNPNMPKHKVIMVTNAFCMTDKQAKNIIGLARQNSATIIWLVAPGLQTPKGFNLERTSKITGFKIRSADVDGLPIISLNHSEHPWSRPSLSGGGILSRFGGGPHEEDDSGSRSIGPLFYIDASANKDTVVLGTLDVLCEPGLAVHQMDGYTSIYCAAPYVHNALLRNIGSGTGAHIYLDSDDLIHVANNLILVHAKSSGKKQIQWHKTVQIVYDLYSGREIAENCQNWSFRMKQHETRFFFAGTKGMASQITQCIKNNSKFNIENIRSN